MPTSVDITATSPYRQPEVPKVLLGQELFEETEALIFGDQEMKPIIGGKEMQELGDDHYKAVYWSVVKAYVKAVNVDYFIFLAKTLLFSASSTRKFVLSTIKGHAKLVIANKKSDPETVEKVKAFLDDFKTDPLVQRMLKN
ncbi:MAG TPA: hypothetical protein VLE89_08515 [Chlamydiales bacterium]|nr:hypothetical protein [Chlamydiales bacterium]